MRVGPVFDEVERSVTAPDNPAPSTAGRFSFALAPVLLWMTAAACLLYYAKAHPPGTFVPDDSPVHLTYIVLFAAIGGVMVASLAWYTPAVLRGEIFRWEPGQTLLYGLGWMLIGDCVATAVSRTLWPELWEDRAWPPAIHRNYVQVILVGSWCIVVASALTYFLRETRWKVASAVLAVLYLPFILEAAVFLLDSENPVTPDAVRTATSVAPWVLLLALGWAVVGDIGRRYGAAHWLGVTLFIVVVAKLLHYVHWFQQISGFPF
jgi:hypothetical protein